MDNYIFFWRLKDNNAYLCQWTRSPFITSNGLRFATAEQYMMYYKAVTFNDFETAVIPFLKITFSDPHWIAVQLCCYIISYITLCINIIF